MTGVITFRHVLAHPVTVVRGFGCRVLVRCVWAACRRERRTFLSIAAGPDVPASRAFAVEPRALERSSTHLCA